MSIIFRVKIGNSFNSSQGQQLWLYIDGLACAEVVLNGFGHNYLSGFPKSAKIVMIVWKGVVGQAVRVLKNLNYPFSATDADIKHPLTLHNGALIHNGGQCYRIIMAACIMAYTVTGELLVGRCGHITVQVFQPIKSEKITRWQVHMGLSLNTYELNLPSAQWPTGLWLIPLVPGMT